MQQAQLAHVRQKSVENRVWGVTFALACSWGLGLPPQPPLAGRCGLQQHKTFGFTAPAEKYLNPNQRAQ